MDEHHLLEQEFLEDALFANYHIRTDLAMEAVEVIRANTGREIEGAKVEVEETENARVTRMAILTAAASRQLGKLPGHYSTIEAPGLRERSRELQEEVAQLVAKEVERFLKRIGPDDPVLVVGLGNWNATPDALGPRVVHHLLVTRHLFTISPPELREGLRPVAAIAPGVLGITGIETGEIVLSLVRQIRPAMVIAIDALAARETNRLCTTIQIADSGISPGSGLGNRRLGITQETLGIPVLAIGVPTVVHAITIASDAMDIVGQQKDGRSMEEVKKSEAVPAQSAGERKPRLGPLLRHTPTLTPEQKRAFLSDLLSPELGTLVVTPKEIDMFIKEVARTVAGGLNTALHPGVELEDALKYIQ